LRHHGRWHGRRHASQKQSCECPGLHLSLRNGAGAWAAGAEYAAATKKGGRARARPQGELWSDSGAAT
jgi:hypothetical protein